MKFKKIRCYLRDINNMLHLRSGRFCNPASNKTNIDDWHVISDFPMKIRWREELGELNQNRIHNMQLCCSILDGIIIKQREIFSMYHLIGDATYERGFKDGPIIVNNQLTTDIGGGLCQISTALFNVALMANCKIIEKHNHSSDIWGNNRIIELGRDATYAYPRLDIMFENINSSDIVLRLNIDRNNLVLNSRLLSPVKIDHEIQIKSEVLKEIIPAVKINDASSLKNIRNGWLIKTQRTIIENDGSEFITYDKTEKYKPVITKK
ncbi:VanW family protein [Bacteroidota bacterium]